MPKFPKTPNKKAGKPPVAKQRGKVGKPSPTAAVRMRADTKQAKLIAMLRRPAGATIVDLAKATGWQHHTVRGVLSGALKKRLGLAVTSEKTEGRDRIYRLP